MRQCRSFAGGSAGHEEIDPRLDLPRHKIPKRLLVNGSILMERGYEGGTASAKLHENKITRIGRGWKTQPLNFPPYILEIVETFFPCNPLCRAHSAFSTGRYVPYESLIAQAALSRQDIAPEKFEA